MMPHVEPWYCDPSHPHGTLVLVDVADADLSELEGEERNLAQSFSAIRLRAFVAGRRAARLALKRVGVQAGAILMGAGGQPLVGPEVSLSISHKRDVAGALVRCLSESSCRYVGMDIEEVRAPSVDISRRVLSDEERRQYGMLLTAASRLRYLLGAFSAKEAIYKAIYPIVRRYVGFREVELHRDGDSLRVSHSLTGDSSLVIEATQMEVEATGGSLLVSTALAYCAGPRTELGLHDPECSGSLS